jgi:hypothetical protein
MRYGDAYAVAGVYEGRLNNAGERIELVDAVGEVLAEFIYDEEDPWPEEPDGLGAALVLRSPASKPDPALAESWMAGPALERSSAGMGMQDWLATQGIASPEEDGDADGLSAFAEYALGTDPGRHDALNSLPMAHLETLEVGAQSGRYLVFRYPRRSGVSDVVWTIEGSPDLREWEPVEAGLTAESTRPGTQPGQEEVAFRLDAEQSEIPDAVASSYYYRLRMRLR